MFIDDRNVGGLPDWGTIYQMIKHNETWESMRYNHHNSEYGQPKRKNIGGIFSLNCHLILYTKLHLIHIRHIDKKENTKNHLRIKKGGSFIYIELRLFVYCPRYILIGHFIAFFLNSNTRRCRSFNNYLYICHYVAF